MKKIIIDDLCNWRAHAALASSFHDRQCFINIANHRFCMPDKSSEAAHPAAVSEATLWHQLHAAGVPALHAHLLCCLLSNLMTAA